jgi:hypothetical protein
MRRRNVRRVCVCHLLYLETNHGHEIEQILQHKWGRPNRLYGGGLSDGEKQIERIWDLGGANGGRIRINW